jgi:hypothetical protein
MSTPTALPTISTTTGVPPRTTSQSSKKSNTCNLLIIVDINVSCLSTFFLLITLFTRLGLTIHRKFSITPDYTPSIADADFSWILC